MRAEDLVACDQALFMSYVKTGNVAAARALTEEGIRNAGRFAGRQSWTSEGADNDSSRVGGILGSQPDHPNPPHPTAPAHPDHPNQPPPTPTHPDHPHHYYYHHRYYFYHHSYHYSRY